MHKLYTFFKNKLQFVHNRKNISTAQSQWEVDCKNSG